MYGACIAAVPSRHYPLKANAIKRETNLHARTKDIFIGLAISLCAHCFNRPLLLPVVSVYVCVCVWTKTPNDDNTHSKYGNLLHLFGFLRCVSMLGFNSAFYHTTNKPSQAKQTKHGVQCIKHHCSEHVIRNHWPKKPQRHKLFEIEQFEIEVKKNLCGRWVPSKLLLKMMFHFCSFRLLSFHSIHSTHSVVVVVVVCSAHR